MSSKLGNQEINIPLKCVSSGQKDACSQTGQENLSHHNGHRLLLLRFFDRHHSVPVLFVPMESLSEGKEIRIYSMN